MNNLSTEIAGIKMKTPILVASGTFGFGEEYRDFVDFEKLDVCLDCAKIFFNSEEVFFDE